MRLQINRGKLWSGAHPIHDYWNTTMEKKREIQENGRSIALSGKTCLLHYSETSKIIVTVRCALYWLLYGHSCKVVPWFKPYVKPVYLVQFSLHCYKMFVCNYNFVRFRLLEI